MTGPIGGVRPAEVKLPDQYRAVEPDLSKRHPLIVLLHGYGATGVLQDLYLRLSREANPRGYVVALPDGTLDSTGQRFWNATDACCDVGGTAPDDVAYVRDLVRQIVARYSVDPGRVYVVGHSNGAFLALRLACERAKQFAAVVSLAGATWADASRCQPEAPIAVLTIHGTVDAVIGYGGGTIARRSPMANVPYPSAAATIATFASRNGCESAATETSPRDFVVDALGPETRPLSYPGCKQGGETVHWPLRAAGHVPTFSADFVPALLGFMEGHARR
jgi:polyhydroxybutyrate depolymerase